MVKRLLRACAALTVLLTVFPFTYAAESLEQRYIVRLRYSNAGIMGVGAAIETPFDVVGEAELGRMLKEKRVLWFEEDYSVELFEGEPVQDSQETEKEKNSEKEPVSLDTSGKKYDESQWGLSMIAADFTYMLNCEGQDVKIGVIDSGISVHEDLQGNVLKGYDYLNGTEDTTDTYGHGTFVSGLIAALDDGKGMIGVAPKAKLVPLKCFSTKTTNVSVICKAIYGAVDDFDCDIINMSFGLKEDSRALREAIEYAAEKGVLVVAAVGNYGSDTLYYPAAYDSVIGVGAVDQEGKVYSKSQHNKSVFITAPGVGVKSISHRGGYTTGSGTSYSTPLVTAAAAVIKTVDEGVTGEQIKAILAAAAVDKGEEGYDEFYGNGILNLRKSAESLLKDVRCFISPVEDNGKYVFVTVYNPSDEEFKGSFWAGEYLGRRMQKMKVHKLTVPAGQAVSVECDLPESTARYFVWESPENNAVVSNTRVQFMESHQEEPAEAVKISVDLSETDVLTPFALSIFSTDGRLVYAVQDEVPNDRTYEILISKSFLIGTDEPDISEAGTVNPEIAAESLPESNSVDAESDPDTEALCGLSVTVYINGTKSVLPLAAHEFEDTVVPPTQGDEGYTEHVCHQCGYRYRDAATMPLGFTVAYDANGGEGAPETQNKQPSAALLLSDKVPVRQGYSFLGWSTDPGSETPLYEAGGEYVADEDTVLYALWRVNHYALIYLLDGEEYKTLTLAYGAPVVAESAPLKSGYTFTGWSHLPETMPAQDIIVTGSFVFSGGTSYRPPSVILLPADTQAETEKEPEIPADKQDLSEEEDYTVELFSFADVEEDDWYYESIRGITRLGLMQGITETEFAPEMAVPAACLLLCCTGWMANRLRKRGMLFQIFRGMLIMQLRCVGLL